MDSTSKAVVGIVTRNRASLVTKSIRSAIEQEGCIIRICVCDDGSTDGTPFLQDEISNVEWSRKEHHEGYMPARNHWMATCSEEYFVSLDDDAWFLAKDSLKSAIDFLDSNIKVAAVAFDILSPDRPDPAAKTTPKTTAIFIGCGHVVRVSAVREVGMYQPTPGAYGGEEKDLCLRLWDAGFEVVLLPGIHVWHDKTHLARDFKSQYKSGVCNDMVLTVRRTPAVALIPAFSAKIIQHFSFASKNQLVRRCLAGMFHFLKTLPATLETRKPVKWSTLRHFYRLSRSS